MPVAADKIHIDAIGMVLVDHNRALKERFRALFTLKNLGGQSTIDWICKCLLNDSSALLKHECAYCLGQMQDNAAIETLSQVLKNTAEDPMVRHEAGEALGAIGSTEVMDLLEKYAQDPVVEVAETCQLAVSRIQWMNQKEEKDNLPDNPFLSVDPAPPCAVDQDTTKMKEILLDESQPLFQRYRAMFGLRNKGDTESVLALADGLKCKSALFRHEIAYVLGQLQHEAASEQLLKNLQDTQESPMVRHECAEALGAIATEDCMAVLKDYLNDPERVVKESCEVALDMCEYELGGEFQYADALKQVSPQSANEEG